MRLISDVGMFIEKDMRGIISYIAKRYNKANNKQMKMYDDSKPSKYVTYLDAKDLYSWPMSQYPPYSGLNQCKFNQKKQLTWICIRS